MNRVNNKTGVSGIQKIEALENGKYKVHFSFSEVPVVMNKSYLDNLLSQKEDSELA
ncbi:hypothetical protein [Portibacter lacus]|uniref:Uncharacterized protein n=1 Tax=Portibacter lacus TaxID=1099794 RepID=A0AA37WHX1_9BACT|nr:hypothetical protein [Portibacter lacus]GLR20114.1 hypothetical protein GCM10007940_47300 [Portibacter lacus]